MSIVVSFSDVGACKRSWTATLPELSYDSLYKQVKKRGGLMSRGIEFVTDDDAKTGAIFVGVFRCVGRFSWHDADDALQTALAVQVIASCYPDMNNTHPSENHP